MKLKSIVAIAVTVMTVFSVLFFKSLNAQDGLLEPVKIKYSLDYVGNNEVEVVVSLDIDKGWHTYSLTQDNPMGPLATVLTVRDSLGYYKKVGKPFSSSHIHKEFEPAFEMEVEYYEDKAVFKQKIQLQNSVDKIKGIFEYQTCDNSRCLPPDYQPFELEVKSNYFSKSDIVESVQFGEKMIDIPEDGEIEGELFDPIFWEFSVESLGKGQVEVTATPQIEEGWHLYADLGNDLPIPTTFWLAEAQEGNFKAIGKNTLSPELPKDAVKHDDLFNADVAYIPEGTVIKQKFMIMKEGMSSLKGELEFQTCDSERCLPPTWLEFGVDIDPDWYDPEAVQLMAAGGEEKSDLASESWWSIFIKGFGGGLIALLTPCVFPMIPMTVNFFMKQSDKKSKGISNAILFGLSIIFIYTAIGFGLTKGLGPDVMNLMASSSIMNIIFFIVFIVFGISFLGAFDITLPAWIVNKSDKQADKGGMIGLFFMAFTLAVVSFSCTGPIIGSLLVLAAQGGNDAGPIAGMLGFSSALALPFTLFAIFPSWLANLPKSGGWLNSVKVVLGLVEFALALKFLSNVDLAYHWGILSREVFVAIWVVIFAIIGFYLLGKIKFSHDSDLPYVSVPRVIFAILAFSFTVYLLPGLFGAPLKLMSGLAPPKSYVEDVSWMRRGTQKVMAAPNADGSEQLSTGEHCPNGLPCTKDYAEGLAYAKKHNKPIFLDFTGHTCVNCRKMEDNTWPDPKIDKILRNDYVVISLYVDDKKKLPKEEQRTEDLFGKEFKIRTVGNKWTYMQASTYKTNSQPYYVLLTPDEEVLVDPVGYTPDTEEYEAYLKSGLEKFGK